MKVFVGLSGGVDSSVAAHLLKQEGHEVTGVFIRTWQPAHVPCTQPEDERSAFAAAAHLDIPFLTLDLSEVYRTEVGEQFIASYARGETPNPDVLCNVHVKFGAFLQFARAHGADAVATGHYARLVKEMSSLSLARGRDIEKDQSYFLALVDPTLFPYIRFPLGEYRKSEIRDIAARSGLPNAARKDSQGICFLGQVDLREFLTPYITLVEGPVLDSEGVQVGTHHGAALYTIGERHGFTAATSGEAQYVHSIDITANTVTVGSKEALPTHTTLTLRDVTAHGARSGMTYDAVVRYHGEPVQARTQLHEDGVWQVHLSHGARMAPGQTVVLYEGDIVRLAGILTG